MLSFVPATEPAPKLCLLLTDPPIASVLIVDDARDFCETLAWLLNDDGYECRVADNGQQALDMLAAHDIQLILLDWEMPIMNSAEFLKQRSLRPDLLRIPVLVLSAAMNIDRSAELLKAHFLQKPIDYGRFARDDEFAAHRPL